MTTKLTKLTKLNPKLEGLAIKLAESLSALTDALDDNEAHAVVARASTIMRAAGALQRLMRASGCPEEGKAALPWLIEHGLIKQLDDGTYLFGGPGPVQAE